MKPDLLFLINLPEAILKNLSEHYNCHLHSALDKQQFLAIAPSVRAVVSSAESTVPGELIAKLPALEIISVMGVGYDGVDLDAARKHNVCVTNTPGLSTEDIADFTMGLLLCAARQIHTADQYVRNGKWVQGRYPMTGRVFGGRMGIVGLGRIGKAVALRAEAFGMSIAYTGRSKKPDETYAWHDDVKALAADVDFLVICASAGPETQGMINDEVLTALGPRGVLVNIARGSIVDEQALICALQEGKILAAGLDVFSDEPHVPQALKDLPNVVLTPHMASTTEATVQAMFALTFENLATYFSGQPALNQVN